MAWLARVNFLVQQASTAHADMNMHCKLLKNKHFYRPHQLLQTLTFEEAYASADYAAAAVVVAAACAALSTPCCCAMACPDIVTCYD